MSTTKLARTDIPVSDLQLIAEKFESANTTRDKESKAVIDAELAKPRSVLARLRPNAVERALTQSAVAEVRRDAARREAEMELYTETKLEIARKQADALLASVGMALQTGLGQYALAKIQEITHTVNESRRHTMATLSAEYDAIAEYEQWPVIHERALAQLDDQLAKEFDVLKRLLDGFVEQLGSRIAASGRPPSA